MQSPLLLHSRMTRAQPPGCARVQPPPMGHDGGCPGGAALGAATDASAMMRAAATFFVLPRVRGPPCSPST